MSSHHQPAEGGDERDAGAAKVGSIGGPNEARKDDGEDRSRAAKVEGEPDAVDDETESGSNLDNDADLEGSDGWDEEDSAVLCILCDEEVVDLPAHLKLSHGITFHQFEVLEEACGGGAASSSPRTGRARTDHFLEQVLFMKARALRMYDRIKVINYLRDAIAAHKCPVTHQVFASRDELVKHLAAAPESLCIEEVPEDDRFLIPRIGHDSLVQRVVALGDRDDEGKEEEEPDYPMVPTMIALAEEKRRGMQMTAMSGEEQ